MKKKKSNIPFSNYIKLFLIVLVTITGAIIIRNIYVQQENYEKNIPIIRNVLINEINGDEIYNYIRENESTVLYIGVSDNKECRSLEEELKQVIIDRNLQDKITYLNITDERKKSSFINDFNKFYGVKVLGYPSFVLFEEGDVKEVLTVKTGNNLSVNEVINFLNRNNITSNDYD